MSDVEVCTLAYEGKYELMKQKIEADKSLITQLDQSGRIPLHWAASGGHPDVVNYLLQQGSPVDPRDDASWTPLMIAASAGRTDIASALIARGAQVNAVNQTGQAPLHYAASRNRYEIAEMLLNNHADINVYDHMGSTPLHRAASKGNIRIVRLFLTNYSNQLDIDAKDCTGNTPLHLACEEDRGEEAKLLIEAGAKTDTLNKIKFYLKGHCGTVSNIETVMADQMKALSVEDFQQFFQECEKCLQWCGAS